MQIGKGKQGVDISEYADDSMDSNSYVGYIQPAGDQPQWIMFFKKNGDADLYTARDYTKGHTGACLGDPIRLRARQAALTTILSRDKSQRTLQQIFK